MLEQRTMLYIPYLQVSKLQMKLMKLVYTSEQAAVKRTGFPADTFVGSHWKSQRQEMPISLKETFLPCIAVRASLTRKFILFHVCRSSRSRS